MPIWNPDATVPASLLKKSRKAPAAEPARDAARMAALKRLRHRMISLCSQQQNKNNHNKPPVLAFERWLSRASLRNTLSKEISSSTSDPIIPSDGILDHGLVKDLSRTLSQEGAQSVAEAMAADGVSAAEKVASVSTTKIIDDSAKQIKGATKAVKKAAKLAQASLEQQDGTSTLEATLASLQAATKQLEACTNKIQRDAGYGDLVNIDSSRRPGIYDVSLIGPDGSKKRPYLTISNCHLLKLLQLWALNWEDPTQKSNNTTSTRKSKDDPMKRIEGLGTEQRISFLNSLYCCLARYEGLKGAGYQCAVPGIAFDAAAEKCSLGTTIECFASPLNCRYKNYCSAFPEIEHTFGSLGSFFDDDAFFPVEGSFEANPPFVPETMNEMSAKLNRLLSNKEAKALSFLVIVPAWGAGIQFCEDLEASSFVRANTRVPAADHAYCDGAQHNRIIRGNAVDLRPSSWDTAVILLQNDSGSKKWPVDTRLLEDSFCSAFCTAARDIPVESATIQKWEQRGVGKGGRSSFATGSKANKRPRR